MSFSDNIASDNENSGFSFANGASSNRLSGNAATGNGIRGFAFSAVSDIVSSYDPCNRERSDRFLA